MANTALASALQIQGRVIWALILRETRARYQGFKLGYLWALIDPLLHLGVWMLIMLFLRHRKAVIGDSVLIFVATGLLPFMMFRSVASFVENSLRSNRALLSYPIVFPFDLMFARFLLESATFIVVAIILFTGIVAAGQSRPPEHYPGLIAATACMLALGFGVGIFNAVMTLMSRLYDYVWNVASRLLYFSSGIFFIPDMLPLQIQYYLWFNPAAHGIEMFRDAFFADFTSDFPYPPYILGCAFVFGFIGLFFERRVRGTRRGETP